MSENVRLNEDKVVLINYELGRTSPKLDYGHPGISRDMHGTNNRDVALHHVLPNNSPFGIGLVTISVANVNDLRKQLSRRQ